VLTSVWLSTSLTTPGMCPSLRTLDLSGWSFKTLFSNLPLLFFDLFLQLTPSFFKIGVRCSNYRYRCYGLGMGTWYSRGVLEALRAKSWRY
jgi:hypothetical protein